ncbi:hypothetical protein TGMAS_245630A, partial [Toxoplasma gondii MAS]
MHDTTLRR